MEQLRIPITEIKIGDRKRSANDVETLKKSIQEIGLLNPITINTEYKLIAGYHRLNAIKQLGWDTVPVNIIESDDLRSELAEIDENIIRKNLSPIEESVQIARRKEIYEMLYPEVQHGGDRKSSRQNGDLIQESFTENTARSTGKSDRAVQRESRRGKILEPLEAKIKGTHIDKGKELDALLKIADKKKGEGIKVAEQVLDYALEHKTGINLAYTKIKERRAANEIKLSKQHDKPIKQDVPVLIVEYGQVWSCGRHTVICSDVDDLQDIKADAVITDPPYGIDYAADWNKWNGDVSGFKKVHNDDKPFDPTYWLSYDKVLLFGANYFCDKLPLGGWLCWDKRTQAHLDNMLGSPFELAYYRSTKTSKKAIMIRVQHGGVVNADSKTGNNDKRFHPTQKPIELMRQVLIELTDADDVILDPYAGSGSTLMACEKTGRTNISVEIDPAYVATILYRYYEETKILPCLESNV